MLRERNKKKGKRFHFWCPQPMSRKCQANILGSRKPVHIGTEASFWANAIYVMKCLIKMFIWNVGVLLDSGKVSIPNICFLSLWKRVQWIQLTEQKRLPKARCTPLFLPRGHYVIQTYLGIPAFVQTSQKSARLAVLFWEEKNKGTSYALRGFWEV